MSQRNNGKPKESRRGRPTTGRDPVVAVRLPHEAIADVDRLARALGLSSRSEAIRYMIMRSTASIGPLAVKNALETEGWLAAKQRGRAKEYGRFQIEPFEREPGKWRASIRRFDASKVRVGETCVDRFITSADTSTADQASELARKIIDGGAVQ
jgi:Arc/MetJ-type ribon-helix-helix transcriptional regulator